jgi:5,10-methylene-tetrahydrofolate dehydrogenase/methenyl tetrahydrofolate cyclohydrolase
LIFLILSTFQFQFAKVFGIMSEGRTGFWGGVTLGALLGAGVLRYMQRSKASRGSSLSPESSSRCNNDVETKKMDGTMVAKSVRAIVKKGVEELKAGKGVVPGLAMILVGTKKDSATYVRMKKKAATAAGIKCFDVSFPDTVSEAELAAEVEKLNRNSEVHGILVQLPLPDHINEATIVETIALTKDVDGLCIQNVGRMCLTGGPKAFVYCCTPLGCMELLRHYHISVKGKHAVVLGRSNLVGMPVAMLLQKLNATVTMCHSRTQNVENFVKQADILVVAIGKGNFVRGSWLKPGCVVIDVGITGVDDPTAKRGYRLVGDVCYKEAQGIASYITPVPGGVGPMTVAMLLKNTLSLARQSVGLSAE